MELPSPLIYWVNPFRSRVINRTIFFCNVLESHECACCLLSFLYFHWLFPLLARETSLGNRSIYKSTRERVDSKGLCGRWRLHLMGSWPYQKRSRSSCWQWWWPEGGLHGYWFVVAVVVAIFEIRSTFVAKGNEFMQDSMSCLLVHVCFI